ncbi:hypothetical protein NDU88_003367 [Pleurodeles waltl]|uniref:Uncharacterized protein n=1 Tax=Pleurodeles waltl TaxID=8319 RepID=A0AAV7SG97_PLEWA|nr:hypothetical protein NDU88_003367 [Pleurodeles waltl]
MGVVDIQQETVPFELPFKEGPTVPTKGEEGSGVSESDNMQQKAEPLELQPSVVTNMSVNSIEEQVPEVNHKSWCEHDLGAKQQPQLTSRQKKKLKKTFTVAKQKNKNYRHRGFGDPQQPSGQIESYPIFRQRPQSNVPHETCVQEQTGRAIDQDDTRKVKFYKVIKINECSTIGPIEHKAAMDSTLSNGIEGAVNRKQPPSTSQPAPVDRRSITQDKETEIPSYINNYAPKRYETYNRKVMNSPATLYQFQEPLTQGRSNQPNRMEQEGRQEEYLWESSPSEKRADWKLIEEFPACTDAREIAQGDAWSRDYRQQILTHNIKSEQTIINKSEKEQVYQGSSNTNSINWKEIANSRQ